MKLILAKHPLKIVQPELNLPRKYMKIKTLIRTGTVAPSSKSFKVILDSTIFEISIFMENENDDTDCKQGFSEDILIGFPPKSKLKVPPIDPRDTHPRVATKV